MYIKIFSPISSGFRGLRYLSPEYSGTFFKRVLASSSVVTVLIINQFKLIWTVENKYHQSNKRRTHALVVFVHLQEVGFQVCVAFGDVRVRALSYMLIKVRLVRMAFHIYTLFMRNWGNSLPIICVSIVLWGLAIFRRFMMGWRLRRISNFDTFCMSH